jgi:hypothetical protein
MRVWIALVVAGVVLGSVGTAVAGESYYWKERGTSYTCEGASATVRCYEVNFRSNYRFVITPRYLWLQLGQRTLFSCERRYDASSCLDHRR